jgi:hypothetical protein
MRTLLSFLTHLAQVRRFLEDFVLPLNLFSLKLHLTAIIMRPFLGTKSRVGAMVWRRVVAIIGTAPGVVK